MGVRKAHRWARRWGIGALAALCAGLLVSGGPEPVRAAFDPLYLIRQQIKRPNVLIAMDTSGSMVAVPGGEFRPEFDSGNPLRSNEIGIDCDNGVNCRGRKICDSKRDGTGAPAVCMGNWDCWPKACKHTGEACYSDSSCTNMAGKCDWDGRACYNASTDCPQLANGTCTVTPWVTCNPGSCPYTTVRKCDGRRCSKNWSLGCGSDADCGDVGPCVDNCWDDNVNRCDKPWNNCKFNTCDARDNGDRCNPDPSGGGYGMCKTGLMASDGSQGSLKICLKSTDCPLGETCQPGTSRAVMAKRAISSVINETERLINFGLMTYYQVYDNLDASVDPPRSCYFSYLKLTGTTTQTTETVFFARSQLRDRYCFTWLTGPSSTCRINGKTYTLVTSNNSRYSVFEDDGSVSTFDATWSRANNCLLYCSNGEVTGNYRGSYYTITGFTSTTVSEQKTVRPTYEGPSYIDGAGAKWDYIRLPPDYQTVRDEYNRVKRLLEFDDCNTSCSASCGGFAWNPDWIIDPMAPLSVSQQKAARIIERMAPANAGGLIFDGRTTNGCMLDNTNNLPGSNGWQPGGAVNDRTRSAYAYMTDVLNRDALDNPPAPQLPCRGSYVVLLTDGEANGPGEQTQGWVNGRRVYLPTCADPRCAAADPIGAGCPCRAVNAAYKLRMDRKVKTFVIGFAGDAATPTARLTNDNIARAGGTDRDGDGLAPFAYLAMNEEQLKNQLLTVLLETMKGSYTTSPATTSSGTQDPNDPRTITQGQVALEARVDFPAWKGHLNAYDMTTGALLWDAATRLDQVRWCDRRIYVGRKTVPGDVTNDLIRVQADCTTNKIVNAGQLFAAGLGASVIEADKIMRFAMGADIDGDGRPDNRAILGAIVNSTPIDVGPPGRSWMPGGNDFFLRYKDRPRLTYVGSDDGMLHAFFSKDTTVAGRTYLAGSEAFAFVPGDMLQVLQKLYANRGQPPEPDLHIYGVANSPKVKNLCVGACASVDDWRTVLVMGEGPGGNDIFSLDITNPVSTAQFFDPPIKQVWHSGNSGLRGSYDQHLGTTLSLPAFFLYERDASSFDQRLIFASGYAVDPASFPAQGTRMVSASASTGVITDNPPPSFTQTGNCTAANPGQTWAVLTDAATARNFANWKTPMLAAYVGDTWGNLWRYQPPAVGAPAGRLYAVPNGNLGCSHPLHFSPAVVQLDRDDPLSSPREVYLVQVTNSALDVATSTLPSSQMVILKEKADSNNVFLRDGSFGVAGKATYTVGSAACSGCAGSAVNFAAVPAAARPASTPTVILRADAYGFLIFSVWYVPPVETSCAKGQSYVVVHEVLGNQVVLKKVITTDDKGNALDEPIASPVVAANRVYVVTTKGIATIDQNLGVTFRAGGGFDGFSGVSRDKRFRTLNWTEK